MARAIETRRVAGALGAEVINVDLARDLSDGTIGEIKKHWHEHLVLFFRDQNLSSAEFLAFARRLGEPMEYPFLNGLDGFPLITAVVKRAGETVNFGGVWHSDTTYLLEPPKATLLIAREIPPYGGDTLFANMYLAYETMSDGMKRLLEGLVAVNSSAKAGASKTREDRLRDNAKADVAAEFHAEHPVVRTHPETGRKSLYVNPAHTLRLRDMSDEESAGLLETLFHHQVRPEFTCRFTWQPGSIALWDNRCTLHNPVNDYHGHARVMHRITLKGDKPM